MMMYRFGGMMNGSWGAFGLITWILLILFLVLGIMYFVREIDKPKRK